MRTILMALLFAQVLLSPLPGASHPGRLNSEGCHQVRREFRYESGKVVRKGEYHCHRLLGQGLRLDGREILEERPLASPPEEDDTDGPDREEAP